MIRTLTLYATPGMVDSYADMNGKTEWTSLTETKKKDLCERASRSIYAYHKQADAWMVGELRIAAILQAIHLAKFAGSIDLGLHASAASSGAYNDGVVSVEAGSGESLDSMVEVIVNEVMATVGLSQSRQFGRG